MAATMTTRITEVNLDFFNHFDQIIALMNELDITAHIMIYVWNKNVNWPEVDSPDDNRYFDYVVVITKPTLISFGTSLRKRLDTDTMK